MSGSEMAWKYPFRILAAVTFHFRESRLQYLFQVVRALSEFPVEIMDVVVVTNVDNQATLGRIMDLCEPHFKALPARPSSKKSLSIESHPNLSDPWHLTWSHKHLIVDRFLGLGAAYTHFIYTEDDILLSFDNFCYFTHFREALKSQRLIPSFQRIEYNDSDNRLYLLDQIGVSNFGARGRVDVNGYAFVNLDYPYNAMFILDKDLAIEYVDTRSFDRQRSEQVRPEWGLAERAAMGLCFECPPQGFTSRYVLPVDPNSLITPYWCWVYHVTGNYAKNHRKPFAKTRIDQLFEAEEKVVVWRPPSKLIETFQGLRRRMMRLLGF